MRTLLVTGSDTGVGKTQVVAALARLLAEVGRGVPAEPMRQSQSPDKWLRLIGDGSPYLGADKLEEGVEAHTEGNISARRIQIVKVIETGRSDGEKGDADRAQRLADVGAEAYTLVTFRAPLAPASAAALENREVSLEALVAGVEALPDCDWRILEGAGGIATPLDEQARDWADFAIAAKVDAIVVVVTDRLGAINQARLALARAAQTGIPAGIWLNATGPVDSEVAASTRAGLKAARVPIWAEQRFGAIEPDNVGACLQAISGTSDPSARVVAGLSACQSPASDNGRQGRAPLRDENSASAWSVGLVKDCSAASPQPAVAIQAATSGDLTSDVVQRCRDELSKRTEQGLRRTLRVTADYPGVLNLADNDYLALAHDPTVAAALASAAVTHGTSASASPLITGWREPHAKLVKRLSAWHGFPSGMLWSSGFAANAAVLSGLPARGDLVLADRLIHASMIAGLLRSGARLQRYEHLRLDRLEELLAQTDGTSRQVFVVTESVFSMDGDFPDLARMAELKRRFGFFWIVDEAHALGWYGPQGAGLVRSAGVETEVDVLVGTLGKTLASGGAYTLFRDETVRDYLVNTAGEFIYSTALPPTNAAAALAALDRVCALAEQQPAWHASSREFRANLKQAGWDAPVGESPIVPVMLSDPNAAVGLAETLRQANILAAAVRPPTVPAGTSRLRFSLKRTFMKSDAERVLGAMDDWRKSQ